jgi:processive 1,2-diacylglycerol beta-glucosyltransferase
VSRYLFLSAPFGTGHWKAAQSVAAEVKARQPEATCFIADLFQYHHPRIGQFFSWTYLQMIRYLPSLYGSLYRMVETKTCDDQKHAMQVLLSRWLGNAVMRLVATLDPDVIVATHPYSLALLSRLRMEGRLPVPVVGVVTDFRIHAMWVYPGADLLCLPAESLVPEAVRYGIDAQRLTVTGIPVGRPFSVRAGREEARRLLELPDESPVALVMSGGLGVGPFEQIALRMASLDTVHTVIVAGKNIKMYHRLRHLTGKYPHIRVLPYVDLVHLYMAAADVLVTKPGGLTAAEALAMQVPMVLVAAIPGQETQNQAYLTETGAARAAEVPLLSVVIRDLLDHPHALQKMKQAARAHSRPDAAARIAAAVVDLGAGVLPREYFVLPQRRTLLADRLEVL